MLGKIQPPGQKTKKNKYMKIAEGIPILTNPPLPQKKAATERMRQMSLSRPERRIHRRFSVKKGAFVVVRTGRDKIEGIQNMSMGEIALAVFKSKPNKIGQIKDMSKSGLCFEYVKSGKECGKPRKLDILRAEGDFCLNDLDFKTISDNETAETLPYEPVRTKLSSVQFVNLTQMQKKMLEAFLNNHTDEMV